MALLERPDRAQQVDLAERRPVDVREVEFAVRALPEQEAGEADLAAGANDQVGLGRAGGVEMARDRRRCDLIDDVRELGALRLYLAEQRPHRIGNLFAPAVGDRDDQLHGVIARGGSFRGPDRASVLSGRRQSRPIARTRTRRRWICGSWARAPTLVSIADKMPEISAGERRKLAVEKTQSVTVTMPRSAHQVSAASSLRAPIR